MKILVFSQAAWDTSNSSGNTMSNLFCEWKNDEFYSIYTRKQRPKNTIVKEYFNRSSTDILKGILRGKMPFRRFTCQEAEDLSLGNAEEQEKAAIQNIHRGKHKWLYFLNESVWRLPIWMDKSLKQYISDADPDIFFAFATSAYILKPLIRYIKKNTRAKVVLYLVDDVYNNYSKQSNFRKGFLLREYKYILNNADKLYAITKEMQSLTKQRFGLISTVLHKGCDNLECYDKRESGTPKSLVYAGNMMYGRLKTIQLLTDALQKINFNEQRAILHIYTNTELDKENIESIAKEGTSVFHGKKDYETVVAAQRDADYNLQIESFEEKNKELVKSSFSTKIIDCLQSGRGVISIGPRRVASIDYMEAVPGAVLITSEEEIESVLENLFSESNDQFLQRIDLIHEYAKENCDGSKIRYQLRKDFCNLLES